jgi:hypothetical protein
MKSICKPEGFYNIQGTNVSSTASAKIRPKSQNKLIHSAQHTDNNNITIHEKYIRKSFHSDVRMLWKWRNWTSLHKVQDINASRIDSAPPPNTSTTFQCFISGSTKWILIKQKESAKACMGGGAFYWNWARQTHNCHNYGHYPSLCLLKHDVSETEFCLRLQAGPANGNSLSTRTIGPKTEIRFMYWVQLSRFHLKTETESCLRTVMS